jgi:FkbM family methyltransferase
MRAVQNSLLAFYRVVTATGALNTAWGRTLFETTYWLYKRHYETGSIRSLQKWVKPGTVVIDVGANIGYFTLPFASWVRDGGKVLAIEPEAVNYARLQRKIARAGLAGVVESVRAAAADAGGDGRLKLNPVHPGDHRLGTTGVPVVVTTIDSLLAVRGWPEVSLIKVDVQGAEARVLAGAYETIDRFQPVLFLEVSDEALKEYGSNAEELLVHCIKRGYSIHTFTNATSCLLTIDEAVHLVQNRGYMDLLFCPSQIGRN